MPINLALNLLGKRNTHISHIYLLVHPYCMFTDEDQIKKFRKIWMDSVSRASKDLETFAIIYFQGLSYPKDKPDELKFYLEPPTPLQLELGRHVQKLFGRERSKFVKVNNIYPASTYDENIDSRIIDKKGLVISARGVKTDACVYHGGCVDNAVLSAIEVYNIPRENASVIFGESIFGNEILAKKFGFSENFIVRNSDSWFNRRYIETK